MADSKKYNGSTWQHSLRKFTTATDTLTTLPADVYADGNNATVGLQGNMSQTGTPTPSSPIQPQETGERTGNLLNTAGAQSGYISENGSITQGHDNLMYTDYIPIPDSAEYITQSATYTMLSPAMCFYDGNKGFISGEAFRSASTKTFDIPDNAKYIRTSYRTGSSFGKTMLNSGSTALPYEPYGYKIPISSANTTTPVYLGEVETERKIRKLVLTGEEGWFVMTESGTGKKRAGLALADCRPSSAAISTHYQYVSGQAYPNVDYFSINSTSYLLVGINTNIPDAAAFKSYLAQQYAAGTPVTVWYVLAEPTTGIVNEPLRKIGDYADEVSGITIPTIAGANTISIGTTLQPSEVTVNYKGWHPVTDVHEAENGAWT